MKLSVKSVVATALLAAASISSAFAAPTVPTPQPVAGPTPSPATNNGGLIVAVWDSVRNVSLTQYLGLSLNDILPANMTTPGTLLDFGTIGATSGTSTFANVFNGSNASDISYLVVAADSSGSGQAGRQLAVTFNGSTFAVNNTAATGAASAVRDFIQDGMNAATGCNAVNPCVATTNADVQFAGKATFGGNLNGQLAQSAAALIGNALHFAYAGVTGSSPSGAAPVTLYANNGTFGQWLLGTDGHLTYSLAGGGGPSVPLPAAVWLLLSGLGSLTVVSRRKAAA